MGSVSRNRVLVDAGPIVAIFSQSDEHHDSCVRQLQQCRGSLLTCWPVVTEAAWLLQRYPDSVGALLSSLKTNPFQLLSLTEADLPGISELLLRYENLGLQLADASLVHLANRENIEVVFTLDRRDFSVVRRSGGKRLRLIP
ncbi:MAG: PIN domain-containing protein [Acidobacteriaceae bacterium]|nr:PIN domain-containing protein [Acidobacteriaceae bacterium]